MRRLSASRRGATRPRAAAPRARLGALLWLASFVLALFSASGLGRSLHFAVVDHARCEHGDYVHPQSSAPHVGDSAEASAAHAPRTLAIGRGHGDADSHDHCDALAVPPADVPVLAAALPAGALVWTLVAEPASGGCECQPIALLSLAPKSSPPRA